MTNVYGGNNTGRAGVRIKEADGTPDVTGVSEIIVSNGTLTDNGAGIVTIATGGGGGAGTVTSVCRQWWNRNHHTWRWRNTSWFGNGCNYRYGTTY